MSGHVVDSSSQTCVLNVTVRQATQVEEGRERHWREMSWSEIRWGERCWGESHCHERETLGREEFVEEEPRLVNTLSNVPREDTVSSFSGHCAQETLPSVPLWVPTGHATHLYDTLSRPFSKTGRQRQCRTLLTFVLVRARAQGTGSAVQLLLRQAEAGAARDTRELLEVWYAKNSRYRCF